VFHNELLGLIKEAQARRNNVTKEENVNESILIKQEFWEEFKMSNFVSSKHLLIFKRRTVEEFIYSRTRSERELFISRREFLWISQPWKFETMKKAKRTSLQWRKLIWTLTARLQRKDEERRRERLMSPSLIKLNPFAIFPLNVWELLHPFAIYPLKVKALLQQWVSSLIHIVWQKSYIHHFQLSRTPLWLSTHWSHYSHVNLLLKIGLNLDESLLDGFNDLLSRV